MSLTEGTRQEREPRHQRPSTAIRRDAGAAELRTHAVLGALPAGWRVIQGRHWPGRTYDVVDHIAIGPTGVFVIDSVSWTGPVDLTPDTLDVNGRSRQSAVQREYDAAREVALLLPPHLRDHCFPVVCFARDEPISGWVKAVRICSTATLHDLLERRDAVLTDNEVIQIGTELDSALPSSHASSDERTRTSDDPTAALPGLATTTPAASRRWRPVRSRSGRVAEVVLGVAVLLALVFVGMRATVLHPASDDGPQQHQPVTPQKS